MDSTKKTIYLWGAGQSSTLVFDAINNERCIVQGIIDLDEKKQNTLWNNQFVIEKPDKILTSKFDYIIITPQKYDQIVQILINMGIQKEKIKCFWNENSNNSELFSYVALIKKMDKKIKCAEYREKNAVYEKQEIRVPTIRSSEELLSNIIYKHGSLVRFGDGEFEMMFLRERPWFQNAQEDLANRLKEVLKSKLDNLYIAIADNFGSLEKYTEEAADGIREYMVKSRNDIIDLLDLERIYYNAYVTRPYIIYRDKTHAEKIFMLFKKIWKKRNVLIVEGKDSRIGVGNDLFNSALSIRRIICPQKNAWNSYSDILKCVKQNVNSDDLVCISLGPTATVLAYDLTCMGYQALDIGQVDNEYEWFLRGVEERVEIPGKIVAELEEDYCRERINNEKYNSSIVGRIESVCK